MFFIGTQVKTESENDIWNNRLGQYQLINPIDTDVPSFKIQAMRLRIEDKPYFLEIQKETVTTSFPLNLVNDSEAIFQGQGWGQSLRIRTDRLRTLAWCFVD